MNTSLKACLLVVGFCLPAISAFADDTVVETTEQKSYGTLEVPSDGIERFLPSQALGATLPSTIQGVWWMDGNPLGDILLTLNGASYDPTTRTAKLAVYYPGAYSFKADGMNRSKFIQTVAAHPYMEIQFNEDFTYATIVPHHDGPESIFIPNAEDVNFNMHLVEDGHWVRESSYFGIRVPDYQLRRVVRADGTRDPAYADYLKFAGPTSVIGYKLP